MSKPTWENCPDWANYMAQDRDGIWYAFEAKPTLMEDWWDSDGESAVLAIKNWKDSLQQKEPSFDVLAHLNSMEIKDTAPPLFTHIAVDADGGMWVYPTEPTPNLDMHQWVHYTDTPNSLRGCLYLGDVDLGGVAWFNTVTKL